jgi:hypothetical protein
LIGLGVAIGLAVADWWRMRSHAGHAGP